MKTVFTAVALLAAGTMLLTAQQPKAPSPEEVKGLQAILNTKTVETRVAAVDEFVKSFPNSEYRGYALTSAAEAYESTGNVTKALIYYQQALEANPKDYNSML